MNFDRHKFFVGLMDSFSVLLLTWLLMNVWARSRVPWLKLGWHRPGLQPTFLSCARNRHDCEFAKGADSNSPPETVKMAIRSQSFLAEAFNQIKL